MWHIKLPLPKGGYPREMRFVGLGVGWVVCGDWKCWDKVQYFSFSISDSWWEERFLMALFLNLICSSWSI